MKNGEISGGIASQVIVGIYLSAWKIARDRVAPVSVECPWGGTTPKGSPFHSINPL